ncbi:MAG: hypothetical protein J2P35_11110 [Actinobacteria bacterium]|nr:hypothetical protein [Actinomycetota bacterium]MBO0817968.1 hypothetical protein [Actinomycetota bacterium]
MTVPTFDFMLRLNRAPDEDEIEALYEATHGDADVEWNPDTGFGAVTVNREADTLTEAIISAIQDVERVPGIRVVGAAQDDPVTMLDIARRTGRTRTSVRMLVNGQRGPGGFPTPSLVTTGGEKLWDWVDVATWLRDRLGLAMEVTPHELITADRLLAARAELDAEPDERTRAALSGLLHAS